MSTNNVVPYARFKHKKELKEFESIVKELAKSCLDFETEATEWADNVVKNLDKKMEDE